MLCSKRVENTGLVLCSLVQEALVQMLLNTTVIYLKHRVKISQHFKSDFGVESPVPDAAEYYNHLSET